MRQFPSSPQRWSRWLVLVTLLLATLAPTLSQALALARGEVVGWSQICRSHVVSPRAGQISLEALSKPPPRDLAEHGLFAHCPYCASHAQDMAPLPAPLPGLAWRSDLYFEMPQRFYSAPHSAHAWAPAQSRAPPLTV